MDRADPKGRSFHPKFKDTTPETVGGHVRYPFVHPTIAPALRQIQFALWNARAATNSRIYPAKGAPAAAVPLHQLPALIWGGEKGCGTRGKWMCWFREPAGRRTQITGRSCAALLRPEIKKNPRRNDSGQQRKNRGERKGKRNPRPKLRVKVMQRDQQYRSRHSESVSGTRTAPRPPSNRGNPRTGRWAPARRTSGRP